MKILFTVMKIAFVVAFGIAALVVIAAFWIAFGLMGGMKDAVNDEIRRSKVKYYGPY